MIKYNQKINGTTFQVVEQSFQVALMRDAKARPTIQVWREKITTLNGDQIKRDVSPVKCFYLDEMGSTPFGKTAINVRQAMSVIESLLDSWSDKPTGPEVTDVVQEDVPSGIADSIAAKAEELRMVSASLAEAQVSLADQQEAVKLLEDKLANEADLMKQVQDQSMAAGILAEAQAAKEAAEKAQADLAAQIAANRDTVVTLDLAIKTKSQESTRLTFEIDDAKKAIIDLNLAIEAANTKLAEVEAKIKVQSDRLNGTE